MDTFILKLLLSLFVGSTWVTISTLIAERLSGKLGGLIAGLPSTAVISLLFIGLTQDIDASAKATTIVPLSSGLYSFFFLAYLVLSKRGFKVGLTGALLIWFAFALLAYILHLENFSISVITWFILVTSSLFIVIRFIKIDDMASVDTKKTTSILFKAVLSGIVIGSIVLVSKLAGPVWGGIFATFPALTISTLLIAVRSSSVEFTRLIAKNILISTTTTIGLYAIIVRYFYPEFGLVIGTIMSYLLMLIISVPLYYLVFEKLKKLNYKHKK
ncbi:DUF3147 family protein [Candidatus Dojkabacteria bacterium]|nr:DUF3147 family protein [Candidatus Dojkabacteria bacterium]